MCIYIHTYTQVQANFDKLIGSDISSQTFGSESPPREEHTLQPCPPFLVSLKMKKREVNILNLPLNLQVSRLNQYLQVTDKHHSLYSLQ